MGCQESTLPEEREMSHRRRSDVSKAKRLRKTKVGHTPDRPRGSPPKYNNNSKGGRSKRHTSSSIRDRYGTEKKNLLANITENIIGINATFDGPFGRRKVIYCDYVASGKAVRFIEDYISDNVLPFYANTHTTTSVSALQTSTFRAEARDIIKQCVNASDEDVVIFTGSGTTAAIHKLVNAIQLKDEKAKNTVVIIGPYEHHSNILPWRTSGAKIERVRETLHGELDEDDLLDKLKTCKEAGLEIIVALSAASNVTGIRTNTTRIAELIHEYGGLSFWDYACAGPYVDIDLNPTKTGAKDAVFISPHKFLGGPGTPGILMAKRKLFINEIPGGVGGGTVTYVTNTKEHYVNDIEEREEGGTPAIVESIRAGLTFQLKQSIGTDLIEEIEDDLCRRAFKVWKANGNIQILGSHTAHRLPIFSILISHPASKKFLHHNFVSVLLNDLYGIQARGGCACAGPYAMDLLCITESFEDRLLKYLVEHKDDEGNDIKAFNILKPGFARLNFPYFHNTESVDFITTAVDRIATDGWKLLPLYKFDPHTGIWQHRFHGQLKVAHLKDAILEGNQLKITEDRIVHLDGDVNLQDVLTQADHLFKTAHELCRDMNLDDEQIGLGPQAQDLVWFLQPKVALLLLRAPGAKYLTDAEQKPPFFARRNTLVCVRNKFISAMENLGYETDLDVCPDGILYFLFHPTEERQNSDNAYILLSARHPSKSGK